MLNSVDKNNIYEEQTINDLPPHLLWLKLEAPGFSVHGDKIKVLFTPDEFHTAIVKGLHEANDRISLAALYIGTGASEQELVGLLDGRLTERGDSLKVSILLDAARGARDQSVITMLLPLIKKHSSCQVCLFHNPKLRGFLFHLFPYIINETVGVQHIKLYVFDNKVIISGANLTNEYFTVRQDRYMVISDCQPLADFCTGLIENLSLVSLQLVDNSNLVEKTPGCHPYLSPPEEYVKMGQKIILDYYKQALKQVDKKHRPGNDTWVFPVLQLPPLRVLQDSWVTQKLLETAEKNTLVHMAIPYFNLPDDYITLLLEKSKAIFNILIPHPTANDFFGARGIRGHIPTFYTVLANNFLCRVEDSGQTERVSIQEFSCPNGSFHCKGLWLTEPQDVSPYLTIIGSSNFNYRSVNRDLECQMVVVTRNKGLQKRLHEEHEQLYRSGAPFTTQVVMCSERRPSFWHYLFLWFFKECKMKGLPMLESQILQPSVKVPKAAQKTLNLCQL